MTLGKNFEVVITAAAEQDLDSAYEYYSALNEAVASRFINNARAKMTGLSKFWATELRKSDIRRTSINRFPYSIFYKVDTEKETIRIVGVRHNRMRGLPGQ
jgi:plasmid stabilization system protein ParE